MSKDPQQDNMHPLTNAERQARYRARQAEHAGAAIRYRRPADRRTRPQRWRDAVAELIALQADYATWADALPDTLRQTATGEALQAIVDLDLTDLTDIDPPRGYGRD
jgi:UDP-N-acetylglucosamine:LPS N-acetylglucosamine transferase